MMANAGRDPYWTASVKAETLATPAYRTVIEDKCATCHMPMARATAAAAGEQGRIFSNGFLDPKHDLHILATDGVSCTLCHQIREMGFGEPASFSGGYVIDTKRGADQRPAFGPYPVPPHLAGLMQAASGFVPVYGEHVTRSELCASCHTLYTHSIDAEGNIGGEFPEQMPYLEYMNSDYRNTHACQDCHMPAAEAAVRIAIGGEPRTPFSKHAFVGGNAYMARLLKTFGQELGVTGSSDHFDHTMHRVIDLLQNRTARVSIESAELSGSQLTVSTTVHSKTGHKFPTGFPSRRAWLHVTVRDATGRVVFDSGTPSGDGSIAHNDNDADGARYEPHYRTIDRPEQVQIYETIMADSHDRVTTTLLRAARYLKDNRLLPSGFDTRGTRADIAVRGEAAGDEDFTAGGDRVHYVVALGDARGPFTVSVELLYQSLGHRWVENLRRHDAPEIARFLGYYGAVPNLPIVVGSATTRVRAPQQS